MKIVFTAMYVAHGRMTFTVLNGKVIDCEPKYPKFLNMLWEDVKKMSDIRDIEGTAIDI